MGLHARHIEKAIDRPGKVSSLNLSNYHPLIEEIPTEIYAFKNLEVLDLRRNRIREIPERLFHEFPRLKRLLLDNNQLSYLPSGLENAVNLEVLQISNNRLVELSPVIGKLRKLTQLDLGHNQLQDLPSSVGNMEQLQRLSLAGNRFGHLPSEILNLPNLNHLDLSQLSTLRKIRLSSGQLPGLRTLDLSSCNLGASGLSLWSSNGIPQSIQHLFGLECLILDHNQIRKIPSWISSLKKLKQLSLRDNKLDTWPEGLASLKNLRTLDLSENLELFNSAMKEALPQVTDLALEACGISSIPEKIADFAGLSHLNLKGNVFKEIPAAFKSLEKLQKLSLDNNLSLRKIEALGALQKLESLSISNTSIRKLPASLLWESLYYLNVKDSEIEDFPAEATNWKSLRKVDAGNSNQLKVKLQSLQLMIRDFNSLNIHGQTRLKFRRITERKNKVELNLDEILIAANSRLSLLRTCALLQLSAQYRKNPNNKPINTDTCLLFSGRIPEKDNWIQLLKDKGVKIAEQAIPGITHIIIGDYPIHHGILQLGMDLDFLTYRDLNYLLNDQRAPDESEANPELLRQFLYSEDQASIEIGLQLIKGLNFAEPFITDLFFLWKKGSGFGVRKQFRNLLELYAPEPVLYLMNTDQTEFDVRSESRITRALTRYSQAGLDADHLASLIFRFFGTGQRYLFLNGKSEVQRKHISSQLKEGHLDLARIGLRTIPKILNEFTDKIESLNLSNNLIYKVPRRIGLFSKLETLDLGYNKLQTLPEETANLKSLKRLSLAGNNIESLPDQLEKLQNLEVLSMRRQTLVQLPEVLFRISSLKVLDLFDCGIRELPDSFRLLQKLTHLNVYGHQIGNFPRILYELKELVYLDLRPRRVLNWQIGPGILAWKKMECLLFGQVQFRHKPEIYLSQLDQLEYLECNDIAHELYHKVLTRNPGSLYCAHAGHFNPGFDHKDNIWKDRGFQLT